MAPITSIQDFRDIARRRIPRAIFDYADGGAYDGLTLAANRRDLQAITLRQRVMIDVSSRNLATTLAGQAARLPLEHFPVSMRHIRHA